MTSLCNLVEDIYKVLENCDGVSDRQIDELAYNLSQIIKSRLQDTPRNHKKVGMSSIGKHPRKLWFDVNSDTPDTSLMTGPFRLKFLYGDIIECIIIWLAKLSGHRVENEQLEVELDGIVGHQDVEIDGEVVDVKSASSFAYKKFKNKTLPSDDPFGYIAQLSSYAECRKSKNPAFLVVDKVTGDICLYQPDPEFDLIDAKELIRSQKNVLTNTKPPTEKCYEDIPDGLSGNRKLDTGCRFCIHKFKCWDSLKAFRYSNEDRYLTTVIKQPKVPDVTQEYIKQENNKNDSTKNT